MKKLFGLLVLVMALCATHALAWDMYMYEGEHFCKTCGETTTGTFYCTKFDNAHDRDFLCGTCWAYITIVRNEPHTLSERTCGTCTECQYVREHDWDEWESAGDEKLDGHSRRCTRNRNHYEHAEHTGGSPTCNVSATCETCGGTYFDSNNHGGNATTDWSPSQNDTTKHIKLCEGCKFVVESAPHDYTIPATCTTPATCVCGATTGEVDPDNHDWGAWQPGHDTNHLHTRSCLRDGCNETETKDHDFDWVNIGGGHAWRCQSDGCSAEDEAKSGYHVPAEQVCYTTTCTVCGLTCGGAVDHTWSDWYSVDETGHKRKCLVEECGVETIRYAHEFTVVATCTTPEKCGKCSYLTGGVDKNNHVGGTEIRNAVEPGEFTDGYTGDTYCLGCDEKISSGSTIPATHSHSYSVATCTTPATCSCNATQGGVDKNNHVGGTEIRGYEAAGEFTDGYTGDTYCLGCDEKLADGQSIPATHVHSYADATCTTPATCSCNETTGAALGHAPGAEADCTNDQLCTRTGCGVVLKEKLGHTEVIDPAVAPSCTETGLTEGKHCDVCKAVLVAQEVVPASGHSYQSETIAPTCTRSGHTTHTCSVCGDTYTDNKTSARGHWYDLWIPGDDGTHSADCKRYGCNYVGTVECTPFEITITSGETEAVLTICPVCGDHGNTPFAAVMDAAIKAVDRYALPRGEMIVRGMEAPFDGVLYAFTAAYEFAGKVEPFKGAVSVTLPLDAEKYAEFKLVRVDVVPATETTERTETWTEIAFTYEDGKLTFETDKAGVFLLLPART